MGYFEFFTCKIQVFRDSGDRIVGPNRLPAGFEFPISTHDDEGLEEGSSDSFGDADEVALSGEDFDHRGLGEFGEIGLGSVAEAA